MVNLIIVIEISLNSPKGRSTNTNHNKFNTIPINKHTSYKFHIHVASCYYDTKIEPVKRNIYIYDLRKTHIALMGHGLLFI